LPSPVWREGEGPAIAGYGFDRSVSPKLPPMQDHYPQKLRKDLTDAERRLWAVLRARQLDGFKFRRQHPVGPFIVDFVCLERSLVIEVDGGQHAENPGDAMRTRWLAEHGWRVLRFWNNEVESALDGGLMAIRAALESQQ
jgi:very-short-patch-repair endonuclease